MPGWAQASGGSGSQPVITVGAVAANSIAFSWTNPNSDAKFFVFLRQAGVATFIAETTATSYTISSGISGSTAYYVEVYGAKGGAVAAVTTPAPTLPALQRMIVVDGSMDMQALYNQDGNAPWFNPNVGGVAQPMTLTANLHPAAPAPLQSVEFLLPSVGDPASPYLDIAAKDGAGSWVHNASVPALPTGGTNPAPALAWSPTLSFPTPIPAGGTIRVQHVSGAGIIGNSNNISSTSFPSGLVDNDGFVPGDQRETDPSYTIPTIGPMWTLARFHGSSLPPKLHIGFGGDSLVAQRRPIAAVQSASKEGPIYLAGQLLNAAGRHIELVSTGQGGAPWSDFVARFQVLLASGFFSNWIGLWVQQIYTYNSQFNTSGASEADARWADFQTQFVTPLAALGVPCVALIMSPPGAANTANNLAGHARMRTLVTANGGIDLTMSSSDDGVTFRSGTSEDQVHYNATGSANAATALRDGIVSVVTTISAAHGNAWAGALA